MKAQNVHCRWSHDIYVHSKFSFVLISYFATLTSFFFVQQWCFHFVGLEKILNFISVEMSGKTICTAWCLQKMTCRAYISSRFITAPVWISSLIWCRAFHVLRAIFPHDFTGQLIFYDHYCSSVLMSVLSTLADLNMQTLKRLIKNFYSSTEPHKMPCICGLYYCRYLKGIYSNNYRGQWGMSKKVNKCLLHVVPLWTSLCVV